MLLEHDHRHDGGGEWQHALCERAGIRHRREGKARTDGERVGGAAADHDGGEACPGEPVERPSASHQHRHHDDTGDGETQRDQVDDVEMARHADAHHDQPACPDGDSDDRAKRAHQETRRHGATLAARHREGAIRKIPTAWWQPRWRGTPGPDELCPKYQALPLACGTDCCGLSDFVSSQTVAPEDAPLVQAAGRSIA